MLTVLAASLGWRRHLPAEESQLALAAVVLAALLVANYLLIYDLTLWAVPLALAWPGAGQPKSRRLVLLAFLAPWPVLFLASGERPFVWTTVLTELVVFALLCRHFWLGRLGSASSGPGLGGNGPTGLIHPDGGR